MSFKDDQKRRLGDETIHCAEILILDQQRQPIGFKTLDFFESVPEACPPNAPCIGVFVDYRPLEREYAATFMYQSDSADGFNEPIPRNLAKSVSSLSHSNSFIHHGSTRNVDYDEPYYKRCRRTIGTDPLFILATGGFIAKDNVVLLQKRSDNGLWGITGGGLEVGEHVMSGACREAMEETGLVVEVDGLLSINTEPECFITYPNGDQLRFIAFLFSLRVTGGDLFIDGIETEDLQWFPVDDLPDSQDPYLERHASDFFNSSVIIH